MKNFILIFVLIITFGCSEENETKTSILLNEKSINISNDKFDELQSLLETKDPKNCNSLDLKNFFEILEVNFDKDNFFLRFTNNEKVETTVRFNKPNCSHSKLEKH